MWDLRGKLSLSRSMGKVDKYCRNECSLFAVGVYADWILFERSIEAVKNFFGFHSEGSTRRWCLQ